MTDYKQPATVLLFVLVAAAAISLVGTLPATAVDEYGDRPTERFYLGETFNISAGVESGNTYEIRKKDTDFAAEAPLRDGDGSKVAFIDTTLEEFPNSPDVEGDFQLVNRSDPDDTVVAEWVVSEQSLALDANRTTVNRNLNDNRNVNLNVQSNRGTFDVYVRSADLDQDKLHTVFAESSVYTVTKTTVDGEDIVRVDSLNAREDITLNFTNRDTGDYNFQVESINASPPDTDIGQASIDFSVKFGAGGSASFQSSTFSTTQGDRVNIPVSLTNTESAVVFIDNDRYNYKFELTDGNGDGIVTVRMDTFSAGNFARRVGSEVFKAADAEDSLSGVESDTLPQEPDIGIRHIDTGQYTLRTTVQDTETDIATLGILERETRGMTLYTMPTSTDPTLDNIEESTRLPDLVRYQNESATTADDVEQDATPQQQIANQDKLVVGINATGIFASVDQTDDPQSVSASDFNAAPTDDEPKPFLRNTFGISVSITQVERDQNDALRTPSIGTAENVIVSPEDDQLYFVLDTGEEATELVPGKSYDISFQLDPQNYDYIDDENANHGENVTRRVEVVERTVEPQTRTVTSRESPLENVYGLPASDITLTGETKIAPRTRTEIRVRSTEDTPVLKRQTARVTENGTVSADFNLSDFEPGRNMSIQYAPLTGQLSARTVKPNAAPNITSTTAPSPVTVDTTSRFDVEVEDEGEVQYQWDFDDGSTSALKNPVHGFSQAGAFNVSLEVTDQQGLSDDVTKTVVVEQVPNTEPVVRAIIGPSTAEANASVNFGVSASDKETDSLSYDWSFGDGTTATGLSVTHSYNSTGVYTVTATVGDGDGAVASRTATISVEEPETEPVEPANPEPTEPEPPANQTTPQNNPQQTPDQPGFGIVAMLVSVIGASTVLYRRRTA